MKYSITSSKVGLAMIALENEKGPLEDSLAGSQVSLKSLYSASLANTNPVEAMLGFFKTTPHDRKQEFRVLLLGGTGQGKTSFLNFLNFKNTMKSMDNIKSCEKFNSMELKNPDGGAMA